MKVITEEDLIARRNKFLKQGKNIAACIVDELLYECKEIDALTVSELRPMSEVPENEFVLCFVNEEKNFERLIKRPYLRHMTDEDDEWHFSFHLLGGWIPMPLYKPEEPTKEMIWPNACG